MFYSTFTPGGTPLAELGKSLLSRRPKKPGNKVSKDGKKRSTKQPAFNQAAFSAYLREHYLPNRTTPPAPATKQCLPVPTQRTGAMATQQSVAAEVIRSGEKRRGEIAEPWYAGPAQPVRQSMTGPGIVAAAAKRDKPTSGGPMDPMAQAIINAGKKRRNEV